MARKLTYAEGAAEIMMHKVTHSWHGYSQPNRSTNYSDKERITLSDGTQADIARWDDDCSSAVRDCYLPLGVGVSYYTYTGNECSGLLDSGNFREIAVRDAQNGDILWRSGHTELLVVVNGQRCEAGFRASEYGSITGATGDQTGRESTYSAFNPGNWSRAFRCIRVRPGSTEPPKPTPKQNAGGATNSCGLWYRAHVERAGWLPSVHDGQTAGTTGYGARVEAIKITPPEGVTLEVSLHIQKLGDKVYKGVCKGKSSGTGSSANDPIMGTTGKSLRIEEVKIKVTENTNAKLKGKTLKYRVHVQRSGWTGWARDGMWSGTRGQSLRIEAIQIKFE